jgi:F420-dependent oxidoreductase-like protein
MKGRCVMVAISLMIEGQQGLTWPRWKRLVAQAEDLGFAGLFRSDHFTDARPPDRNALEAMISLAYLADHTQRIHFGPLVAPLSFRDPVALARQALAIDDLSGGRLLLGLGAGWQEREHHLFGYDLGDIPTRMARFTEGLEVITRLLRDDQPVTFEGRFYQLHEATLLPRPARPGGPPILIGGNGIQRTLPLVARYAQVWNAAFISPEGFQERTRRLDDLLAEAGRQPQEVRRTVMVSFFFGRDKAELERKLSWRQNNPSLSNLTLEEVVEKLPQIGRGIAATPETILEQIGIYEQAGAEEIMLQWLDQEDVQGISLLAESIAPLLKK